MVPSLERVALLSDIHGNLTAFQAVLDDLESRGVTRIFNLGDTVGKGPRGAECVDLSRERCEVHVQGNWESSLTDPDRMAGFPDAVWWRDQLPEEQQKWLRDLPHSHDFLMSGRRLRIFHASAKSVHHRVFFDHDEAEFLGMFANTEATGDGPAPDVVGYGDIHDPYLESDRGGRTLFNVGSVGNPLDDPTPCYVIVEGDFGSAEPGPFSIQFVRVAYDVEAEIAVAQRSGMPAPGEWEVELRTGVYREVQREGQGPRYHRDRGNPALH
ncbi:metallophosphoesterase family protein [Glycomyces rhizosphaerae]|uniref:Metallophosphoesterase family protein n=1 Tax=Glycomyces rhizosphaerae TaxID=2054422 RepID=A0ABV7Q6G3_9ACTN